MKKIALLLVVTFAIETKAASMDVVEFFNKLDKNHMELVDQFYDSNVDFQDPINHLRGSHEVKNYYTKMYKNVESIRFVFQDIVTQGDQQVAVWTMYLKAKGLNGGNEIAVSGNSHIKYKNGKAVFHRDYFDMGEFIYERIPVVGSIIRVIKDKMK